MSHKIYDYRSEKGFFDSGKCVTALKILGKLSSRLTVQDLVEISSTTVEALKKKDIKKYPELHNALVNLLGKVLENLPALEKVKLISDIFSIPIYTSLAEGHYRVKDACSVLREAIDTSYSVDPSNFIQEVKSLCELAKTGSTKESEEEREKSILRLEQLYLRKGLTSEGEALFAEALWSDIDPKTKLPRGTGFYENYLLKLPELESKNTLNLLKNNLLNEDIPSVFNREKNKDGKTVTSYSGIDTSYILNLLGASRAARQDDSELSFSSIFTSSESILLLEKIKDWWLMDREDCIAWNQNKILYVNQDILNYVQMVAKALIEVIYPKIQQDDADSYKTIKELLKDWNSCGFLKFSIRLNLLSKELADKDDLLKGLKKALLSQQLSVINDAFRGINHMISDPHSNYALDLEQDWQGVFDIIFFQVAVRKQPGLKAGIQCATALLKHVPNQNCIKSKYLELMYGALEYLQAETQLPSREMLLEIEYSELNIPLHEMFAHRLAAAQLAHALLLFLRSQETEIPSILFEWETSGKSDESPSIRAVWN